MTNNDYKGRLNEVTETVKNIMDDFIETHELEEGCLYRVIQDDGKFIDGYFKKLKIMVYGDNLGVRCTFYKMKKGGSRSKITTGVFISNIRSITLLPF